MRHITAGLSLDGDLDREHFREQKKTIIDGYSDSKYYVDIKTLFRGKSRQQHPAARASVSSA